MRKSALALLAALLLAGISFAQETTAGLQGTVRDSSGGAVANGTVEVSGPALIGTRKVQTDSAGGFRVAALPPGEYTMSVSAQGFRTFKQAGIDLQVGRLPSIEVKLEVGVVTQTVEITGTAPIVD